MMKICDLTQSYAANGGGVRTYIHAHREFIRQHTAHEHLLIVPGAEDTAERDGRTATYSVASPMVPGSTAYRLLLRSPEVLRILERERPDVINVYCAYNLPWTAFHYRRRHAARVIGIYMTDVPTAYVEPAVRRIAGGWLAAGARYSAEAYSRALYNRCDATVAISPVLAQRLRAMGVRNVQCVLLGVDLETFHPARRDPHLRRDLGIADDDLLMVYAGRLDTEKRARIVADAFEQLPHGKRATLVLVGDGPLCAELTERAAAHPRMHVLPFQPDRHNLATLLASADLYVSGMPFETFGLSVLEAQACGLAVVGVRGGAMVDRVPEGTGLLGPVDDAAAMARNMARYSVAEWRAIGRRARAMVKENFSWDRTFEQIFALYPHA